MNTIEEIAQEINSLPRQEKQNLLDELVRCLDGESIRCLETALDVIV